MRRPAPEKELPLPRRRCLCDVHTCYLIMRSQSIDPDDVADALFAALAGSYDVVYWLAI